MPRPRLRRTIGGLGAWLVVAGLALGCCPRPLDRAADVSTPGSLRSPPPLVLAPSPLLSLARSERERLEPPQRRAVAVAGELGPDEALAIEDEEDSDAVASQDEGDVERRTVVVRTRRFATSEDLFRYALRRAESRRPRELNPTRLLVRRSGPVRACGSEPEARRAAGPLVRRARPQVKACVIEDLGQSPGVLFQSPAALVLEQFPDPGDVAYAISLHLDPRGPTVVTGGAGGLSGDAKRCIARVIDDALDAPVTARVEVPLVVFVQPGAAMGGSPLHDGLAREASILGWVHYQRREYGPALEYFRDAYWLYHRAEFQVLIGMALESLGRSHEAAVAYGRYVEQRPHAPEVPRLRATIDRLRIESTGESGPDHGRPTNKGRADTSFRAGASLVRSTLASAP